MSDPHPLSTVPSGSTGDTLGGRLSAAREAAGHDVGGFARLLGVRETTLRAWEGDRSEPRADRMVRMAGMLGVSPVWLIAGYGTGPDESEPDQGLDVLRAQAVRLRQQIRALDEIAQAIEAHVARQDAARR